MEELMTFHTFQCPSCGAPLLPRGNDAVIRCSHCQTSVIVPEELRQASDADQWTTILYDNFFSNENNWLVGTHTSEYFLDLNQDIVEGRYRWNGEVHRDSSTSTAWVGYPVSDLHLIANGKHIAGSKTNSSWGLIFRVQDNRNYYWFRMTDSQFFAVSVIVDSQWLNLVNWTRSDAIRPRGNNQLEVIGRDMHFIFLINGQIVSELDDDHFRQGMVGLAIEGYTAGEKITFDFLDFTLRAAS